MIIDIDIFIPYTISDDEVLKTSKYTPDTICPNPFNP